MFGGTFSVNSVWGELLLSTVLGGNSYYQQCFGGTHTVSSVCCELLLMFSTKSFRTLLPISVIRLQAVTGENRLIFILENRNMDTIIFSRYL